MKYNMILNEQTGFTSTEKVIANYITSHREEILQMSIQKLARETYTSTSAIMRLCARMGLSGFKEFKIRYAQELSEPTDDTAEIDPNFPFSPNDSVGEIAAQLQKLTVQCLRDARKLLSASDVRRACGIMKEATHVAIFGVGDAYLAGLTFQARMMRTGLNMLVSTVYGEQGYLAENMHRGDCGILLSYSGTTYATVDCAEKMKRNGVSTICITAGKDSPLAKIADITLYLPSKEEKFHRIASFFSQTAMEYYLNVIYSCLYVMDYEKLSKKAI